MGLRAVASSAGNVVSKLIAGTGITLSPTGGVGTVTVTNSGVTSILVSANLTENASTGAVSIDVSSTVVLNTRSIIATSTTGSIQGGGTLAADRTLSLVNDSVAPGNSKYYGTDSGGVKGYFSAATGSGTLTQIDVGTGLATSSSGSTTAITTTGTLFLKNTTVTSGTYGTAASVATFAVNSQGQLTTAINVAIAIDTSAITSGTLVITRLGLSAASGGIVYGTATNLGITAAGTSGQYLVSQGTAAPVWSTPTFPNISGTSGQVFMSDGTNITLSTAVYPRTAGTSGQVLQSNGTNFVLTTATFPVTSATSGGFLQSNGTNWIMSTLILPTSATTNTLLYTSATNTISTLATTATGALVTSSGGVPSMASGTTANRVLRTDGTTVSFSQIDLSTDATGTIPAASVPPDPFVQWLYMI